MLAKNARASVTTVTLALIIGTIMALWLALAPAPAQAQQGDVVRLLSIKAVDITSDEGVCLPIIGCAGDDIDEPYIKVDGVEVWSGRSDPLRMKKGDVRNLTGVSATLSGQSARVQLWEYDPGTINRPDDGPAEFFADYTGGDQRTVTLPINGGVYEITYVVDRPQNKAPEFGTVKPTGRIHDRTPIIKAVVSDDHTNLTQSNITTFKVDNRAKAFGYDTVTDTLVHRSSKLALGKHTVTVTANDGLLENTRVWSFRIVR